MLRRLSRPFVSVVTSLATLYGIDPAMAQHLLGLIADPLRSAAYPMPRAQP